MVVRAFAKKPVQPEEKTCAQQPKAQNNASKAVPAKNDVNKASAQKQVKVQVQNQPKPVEKNKPQQDNSRKMPVINLLLRITNSAIKIRLKTIIIRITKT